MIIYFANETFYLVYNRKIIAVTLKQIISKGMIYHKSEFMEAFIKTLKKEKIKSKLFGDTITILDIGYSIIDRFYLESIFLELGFIKVEYYDVRNFFQDGYATYVLINDRNMILFLNDTINLDLDYFKDIPKILDYFKEHFGDYLIFLGSNSFIPDIRLKGIDVYYLEEYTDFIPKCLLKVKKYGV